MLDMAVAPTAARLSTSAIVRAARTTPAKIMPNVKSGLLVVITDHEVAIDEHRETAGERSVPTKIVPDGLDSPMVGSNE